MIVKIMKKLQLRYLFRRLLKYISMKPENEFPHISILCRPKNKQPLYVKYILLPTLLIPLCNVSQILFTSNLNLCLLWNYIRWQHLLHPECSSLSSQTQPSALLWGAPC
jgi:hypothetical protein